MFFNNFLNIHKYNIEKFQAREVNPCDYDRKIKFWSEMIARSCLQEKDPIVTVDLLKRRFRRGDQLPGSLGVVIESMHG